MVRALNTGWWDVHSVRMWGSAHTDSSGTIYPGEGELYMRLWSGGKPVGGKWNQGICKKHGWNLFPKHCLRGGTEPTKVYWELIGGEMGNRTNAYLVTIGGKLVRRIGGGGSCQDIIMHEDWCEETRLDLISSQPINSPSTGRLRTFGERGRLLG